MKKSRKKIIVVILLVTMVSQTLYSAAASVFGLGTQSYAYADDEMTEDVEPGEEVDESTQDDKDVIQQAPEEASEEESASDTGNDAEADKAVPSDDESGERDMEEEVREAVDIRLRASFTDSETGSSIKDTEDLEIDTGYMYIFKNEAPEIEGYTYKKTTIDIEDDEYDITAILTEEVDGTEIYSMTTEEDIEDRDPADIEWTQLVKDAVVVMNYDSAAGEADTEGKEAEEEQENTRLVYRASSGGATVTATLESADAVPDSATLRVTPITGSAADAYFEAMDDADGSIVHTADNTLLFDIAFIMTDDDGNEYEYQPKEGSVSISIELSEDRLEQINAENTEDLAVTHLPLKDDVKDGLDKTVDATDISAGDISPEIVENSGSGQSTEFEVNNGFSVFGLTQDGNTGKISVSDVLEQGVDMSPMIVSAYINNKKVTEDFVLPEDTDGKYDLALNFQEVKGGQQFEPIMYYRLPNGMQPSNTEPQNSYFEIKGEDEEGNSITGKTLPYSYYISTADNGECYLIVEIDKNDSNYSVLEDVSNANLQIGVEVTIDKSSRDIEFAGSDIFQGRILIEQEEEPGEEEDNARLDIHKRSDWDANNPNSKVHFTIYLDSYGTNNNVSIKDMLFKAAKDMDGLFTLDKDSIKVYFKNGGSGVPEISLIDKNAGYYWDGELFHTDSFSMTDGQKLYIEYDAYIDLSKADNATQTIGIKNTAYVYKDTTEKDNSSVSFDLYKYKPAINKSQEVSSDGREITYTVVINEDEKAYIKDYTLTDKLEGSSDVVKYAKYAGEGIEVNGTLIKWGTDGLTSLTSANSKHRFTYKIGDIGKKKVVITYKVTVDTAEILLGGTLKNTASGTGGSSTTPEIPYTPEEGHELIVTKTAGAIENNQVPWTIEFNVPETGYTSCELEDELPWVWAGENAVDGQYSYYSDKFVDGSIEVTSQSSKQIYFDEPWLGRSDQRVEYPYFITLKFWYYNNANKKTYGIPADAGKVTVTLKSEFGENWLEATTKRGTSSTHTNQVRVKANGSTASATASVDKIYTNTLVKKADGNDTVTIDGTEYPIYKYRVELTGVNEAFLMNGKLELTDTFPGFFTIYEDDTDTSVDYAGRSASDKHIWIRDQYNGDSKVQGEVTGITDDGQEKTATISVRVPRTIQGNDLTPSGIYSSGDFFERYYVTYWLIPDGPEGLQALREACAHGDNGVYEIINNAEWEGKTASAKTTYTYKDGSVGKNETIKPTLENHYVGEYTIVLNSGMIYYGGDLGEDTLDVYDKMTNLKLIATEQDPVRVKYTDKDGTVSTGILNPSWDADRASWKFSIRNGVMAEITYKAQVIGTYGQEVEYSNEVSFFGYKNDIGKHETKVQDTRASMATKPLKLEKRAESSASGESGEPLGGAKFKILKWKGDVTDTVDPDPSHWEDVTDKDGETVTRTTNSEGKASFYGSYARDGWTLDVDKYYAVQEIEHPKGYLLDSTIIPFIIQDVWAVNGQPYVKYVIPVDGDGSITITDKKAPTTEFSVKKYDSVTGDLLDGATFTLTPDTEGSLTPVQTKTTGENDQNGIITFDRLYPGETYTLTETATPEGYAVPKTNSWKVSVLANNEVTVSGLEVDPPGADTDGEQAEGSNAYVIKVPNTPTTGKLTIRKSVVNNKSDAKDPFGATTFDVSVQHKKADGSLEFINAEKSDEGIERKKTDAGYYYEITDGGTLSFSDLPMGEYVIREYDNGNHQMSGNYRGYPYTVVIDGKSEYIKQTNPNNFGTLENKNYGSATVELTKAGKDVVIQNIAKESIDARITGKKHLVGRNIRADEHYTFALYDLGLSYQPDPGVDALKAAVTDGNIIATQQTTGDTNWQTFIFDRNNTQNDKGLHPLHYTWTDYWAITGGERCWWYALKEVPGNEEDMTYDPKVNFIKVVLGPDHYGVLDVSLYYYDENKNLIHSDTADSSITKEQRDATRDRYEYQLEYTNTASSSVEQSLQVLKTISGNAAAKAGLFSFTLEGLTGSEPMPASAVAKNGSDGSVKWGNISFDGKDITDSKTYTYKIFENDPPQGYTKDDSIYYAKITVDKDANGVLTVHNPEYGLSADGEFKPVVLTFDNGNDYLPAKFTPSARKELANARLAAEQFSFTLAEVNGEESTPVETKQNDGSGNITFSELAFDKPGTYTYEIYEEVPDQTDGDIEYDTKHRTLTVTVAVDPKAARPNTLKASASYGSENSIVFNNKKRVDDTSIQLYAKKYVNGKAATAGNSGDFTFTISDGAYTDSVSVLDAQGMAAFKPIKYTLEDLGGASEKTFAYIVTETNNKNYVPDTTAEHPNSHTVKVKLSKGTDENGNTVINASTLDGITEFAFYNKSKETTAVIDVKKTMQGLAEGESKNFTFTLYGRYDSPEVAESELTAAKRIDSKTVSVVNGGQTVTFDGKAVQKYTGEDLGGLSEKTFYYVVKEESSDSNVYTSDIAKVVSVTVKDEDGKLSAAVNGSLDNRNFLNTYSVGSPVINVKKTLEGRPVERMDKFEFLLYKDGARVGDPVEAGLDGNAVFKDFANYSLNDVGKVDTYVVKEVKGRRPHVTYDESEHRVEIRVIKNADGKVDFTYNYLDDDNAGKVVEFTNIYPVSGNFVIHGVKTLNDSKGGSMTLEAGAYTFDLYDAVTKDLIDSQTNAADGSFTFKKLVYEADDMMDGDVPVESKDFSYFIVERNSGSRIDGVDYTGDVYKLTVNVSVNSRKDGYDTKGTLYKASADTETLVKKGILETITDGAGALFNNITGKATSGSVSVGFVNTYRPEGSFKLQITKSINKWPLNTSFTFDVKEGQNYVEGGEGVVLNENNKTSQVFEFHYTGEGTHTYTIAERAVSGNGITYAAPQTVTVVVKDNKKGKLETYVNGSAIASDKLYTAAFENRYDAEGTLVLSGHKDLANGVIEEGQYSVTISSLGRTIAPIPITKDADGSWKWSYSETFGLSDLGAASPKYHVSETVTDQAGVVYDENSYDVEVKLTDNSQGKIIVEPVITASDGSAVQADGLDFKNMIPKDGEAEVYAVKTVSGMNLENGAYEFTLIPDGKNNMGETPITVKNNGSVVRFPVSFNAARARIAYNNERTYGYTIKEVIPPKNNDGVIYDTAAHHVSITVKNDPDQKKLVVTGITYDDTDNEPPVFENKYSAEAETGVKVGKNFADYRYPEKAKDGVEGFTFVLYDSQGEELERQTVKSSGETAEFTKDFRFTQESLKNGDGYADSTEEYFYIEELDDKVSGITYDDNVYLIKIALKNNHDGTLSLEKYVTSVNRAEAQKEGFLDNIRGFFENAGKSVKDADITFDNTLEKSGGVTLSGNKVLKYFDNTAVNTADYAAALRGLTFTVTGEVDGTVQTVTGTTDENGNITFPNGFTFKNANAKGYTFTVKESQTGTAPYGLEWESGKKFTVITADDPENYGQLTATIKEDGNEAGAAIDGSGLITFTCVNRMTRQWEIDKVFTGVSSNGVKAVLALYEGGSDAENAKEIDRWTYEPAISAGEVRMTGSHALTADKVDPGKTYTLKEAEVPAGFEKADPVEIVFNEDGTYTIGTQTHSQTEHLRVVNRKTDESVTSLNITKTWVGKVKDEKERPTPMVQLYRSSDGGNTWSKYQSPVAVTLQQGGEYSLRVDDLPARVYDTDTYKYITYEYDAEELPIEGYTSEKQKYVSGVAFTNTVADQDVVIPVRKVWDDGKNVTAHPAITFRLYADSGKGRKEVSRVVLPAGSKEARFTTDLNGNKLKMYDPDNGYNVIEYTVSEDPVPGYKKGVGVQNADGSWTFTNESIRTKIRKYDANDISGNPEELEGAEFTINKVGGGWSATLKSGQTLEFAIGSAGSGGIIPGDYEMRETKAPYGYARSSVVAHFTVADDGTVTQTDKWLKSNWNTDGAICFEDKPLYGAFRVIKVDGETEEPLSGAEFKLYSDKAYTSGSRVLSSYIAGEDVVYEIGTYTSDSDGRIEINDLEWGTYYLEETKAPEGYVLPTHNVFIFEVDADHNTPDSDDYLELNYIANDKGTTPPTSSSSSSGTTTSSSASGGTSSSGTGGGGGSTSSGSETSTTSPSSSSGGRYLTGVLGDRKGGFVSDALGARKTSGVLGERMSPVTGDDLTLNFWIMLLCAAGLIAMSFVYSDDEDEEDGDGTKKKKRRGIFRRKAKK